jgi:outer membrane protein TolC
MRQICAWAAKLMLLLAAMSVPSIAFAQEAPAPPAASASAPVALTLKRAVELALQNSKDIQVAKIQGRLADRSALISRAEFLPNLYAGSGLGYTYGIPETPGGRAPAIFSVTYTEQVLNEPARGQAKELQEQARSQMIVLRDVRNSVIVRTAMAYLELAKVRHGLELLQKEQSGADRILQVTQERQGEGFELPIEATKAQLTKARVGQRIIQLQGREEDLEVFLRAQLGLPENQAIEVAPEDLPGEAEQEGANLVAMAMQSNTALQLAESDVRAKQFRLSGEKRGYLPTLEFVSIYSVLGKFNNYSQFFNHFQRNNYNLGIDMRLPLFSAKTRASIGLAQVNLDAAKVALSNKKTEVSAEVRQKTRRVREMDAAKEVARLELQLAQQNVSVLQSQLEEGKANLREVERERIEENDKWLAYLDANFGRQQAQLELLRAAGQLDKVWQ